MSEPIKLSTETELALLNQTLSQVREDVHEIRAKMESNYVTKDQFDPIKRLVYGLVSVVLVSVVAAVLSLVIARSSSVSSFSAPVQSKTIQP